MSEATTIIAKLRAHEKSLPRIKDLKAGILDDDLENYVESLTTSIQSLQAQVEQHRFTLDKLRRSTREVSSPDATMIHLREVRIATAAYNNLADTSPLLPAPGSPLPALLAVRSTLSAISQSKVRIGEAKSSLAKVRQTCIEEEQRLEDASALGSVIKQRIDRNRQRLDQQKQQDSTTIADHLIDAQRDRKRQYGKELRSLVRSFNKFTIDHLAIMLAAEDLGGPCVGDNLDLESILPENAINSLQEDIVSKKEEAAAEFRDLTERLLNAAADVRITDPYIKVEPSSAAVRFLVRAKVADFDPNDDHRLRLLNFGGHTKAPV